MSRAAILLATYNGDKYIRELLNSLVRQTYQDYVCYIHDDGSIDQTVTICQEFCRRYPEHFILLEYPGTGSAKTNFFSLMKHTDEDYIFLCDQDDFWLSSKMEKMMKCTEGERESLLVYCDLKITDDKLNIISDSFFAASDVHPEEINYKNALVRGYIPGCAMMFSRTIAERALQYQNAEHIKMHDWWLLLIALMIDARMVYIDEPLVLYRQHENNTVGIRDLTVGEKIKKNLGMLFTGTMKNEKKRKIESRRLQAKELYECNVGIDEKKWFVKEFAEIGSKGKLNRILFYAQNFKNVRWIKWTLPWV